MMETLSSSAASTSVSQPPQLAHAMDAVCGGCKQSIESETGGVVVSFGDALWHVKCFRCAKCHERVTADTNLLLLSDGSPVCGSCSYNCNVCKLPILDEAIMTGDESYHATCFTCRSCSRQINELVFAKTSNGIYCMACHNERVARSRRHAEQKKAKAKREKERAERERERAKDIPATPARPSGLSPNPNFAASPSMGSPSPSLFDSPNPAYAPGSTQISNAAVMPTQTKRQSTQSIQKGLQDGSSVSTPPASLDVMNTSMSSKRQGTRPDVMLNGNGPPSPTFDLRQSKDRMDTLPLPVASDRREGKRRKSYDDGVRPLSHFLNMNPSPSLPASGNSGLEVPAKPTSRADKRRSINPGLYLSNMSLPSSDSLPITSSAAASPAINTNVAHTASDRLSPNSSSPLRSIFAESQAHSGPRSPHSDTQYFSPASSPGLDNRTSPVSPSQSPVHPGMPSPPILNVPSTPPSLTFVSPTPDPTPSRHPAPIDPPMRVNSLPTAVAQSRLAPDESRPGARSASPSRRAPSPSPGRISPSPLGNGGYVHVSRQGSTPSPTSTVPLRPSMDSSRSDVIVEVTPETDDEHGPPPPPKDAEKPAVVDDTMSINEGSMIDGWEDDSSDALLASQTARTISAPALPPMRFSLSATDFTEFLNSVGDTGEKLRELVKREAERSDAASLKGSIPPSPHASSFTEENTVILEADMLGGLSQPSSPVGTTPTSVDTVTGDPLPKLYVNTTSDSEATSVSFGATDDTTLTSPPSAGSISSMTGHGRGKSRPNGTFAGKGMTIVTDAGTETQGRGRVDSSASLPSFQMHTSMPSPTTSISMPVLGNQAANGSTTSLASLPRPSMSRNESSNTSVDLVGRRLREALADTGERGAMAIKLDREFVEAIVRALDVGREKSMDMRGELDIMKRTSHQYIAGLTVAQSEYHKEVAARRDAEAEVSRLRVQLSGQAARLTAMSAEDRRRDMMEQMSRDLSANLHGLERDLSKLKVERDMTLAEVEELSGNAGAPHAPETAPGLTRSLTTRFDALKGQYRKDLEPLKQQREALIREISELKEARDIFLEETTALNARNEELAELNAQIARQIDNALGDMTMAEQPIMENGAATQNGSRQHSKGVMPNLFGKSKSVPPSAPPSNSPSFASVAANSIDEREEYGRIGKAVNGKVSSEYPDPMPAKKFKWFGGAGASKSDKENYSKSKKPKAHNFQQQNVLRFARCDQCGDKMWGPQLRCSSCGIACHPRCLQQVQPGCQQTHAHRDESVIDLTPLPPSMFGRDLVDQVRSDSRSNPDRMIPVIVEKCINAVDTLAIDYEGIYRKTGGSSQSKAITQLFERGNYDAFDLTDVDAFNDISSVTSVLKTYFRSLPNPLLTYALHEQFVSAANIKDPQEKYAALCAAIAKLPREHYCTLRFLMLHLHKVQLHCQENLMTARNLGVVFGPTLMRSSDASKEFADMAGKALSIEFLVQNAPEVFRDPPAYA